jgi:copper(I)-binding protein
MKLKLLALALAALGGGVSAQTIDITDAWVRSTVPGQMATGAFMKITAKDGATLVGVSSPVAGGAAVHEMKMDGGVMTMRAAPALALPAGKTVALAPGGYHVMLMDLKAALPKGSTVALTLVFKDGQGVQRSVVLKLPVAAVAPAPTADHKAIKDGHQH